MACLLFVTKKEIRCSRFFKNNFFYIKEIPHSSYHAESGEHRINTHKNITSHVDWHGTLLSILSCLEFVRTGG